MVDDKAAIAGLDIDSVYSLAQKVEADVEANKYKWQVEK
jgi:hypothetical protein